MQRLLIRRTKHFFRRPAFYLLIFLVIGFVVLVLELTNTINLFHKANTTTITPSSKPSPTHKSPLSKGESSTKSQPATKSGSSSNAKAALVAPYGSFVSNHSPSLSGSSAPSLEDSVCVTTPGASCFIEFTKDGTTKKLPAQTTGSDGSTEWSWDVKQAGFSTGDWKITAIASLNGQTKSAQDSLPLSVKP